MDVSKHLEKAAEALRKKNFDYAINLYHQVLQLKPDHGEARRELRQALVRRAEYKKIPPVIAFIQGLHHRIALVIGTVLKNPTQVILAAEGYLKNDPHNRSVNRILAAALERANHTHSAVAVWEFLGDDERIGDHALKRAGALYYSQQQMQQALSCYETVLKRSPRDSEAEKMRKNLAAEGVLSSGSYDPMKSSRDLVRDKDQQQELDIGKKLVKTEDEQEVLRQTLEKAVTENPADKRARRSLVDHLVKQRDYEAVSKVLEAGIEIDPDSYELRERLGDVRILEFDQLLREARQKAGQGDAAARTDVVDLQREKREFEISEYTRRVGEHPTDLDLRFRLGRLLLADGQTDAAIEAFQNSVKDPRRRVDSLLGLAAAFEKNGMLDLARKQLETALQAVDTTSERATEIRYSLAVLLERSGDVTTARALLETIYEQDINFRDVAARLQELEGSRPEQQAPAEQAAAHDTTEGDDAGEGRAETSTYGFKD